MSKLPPLVPLLTIPEVAEAENTSTKTVRRQIKSGELPAIRIGRSLRVSRDDLERFVASRRRVGN